MIEDYIFLVRLKEELQEDISIKGIRYETNNLAKCDEYKDKINEMREKIIKHRDDWEEQSHPWGTDFWGRF